MNRFATLRRSASARFNALHGKAKGAAAAAGTGALMLASQARAAVPQEVTTVMSDMKTDGGTIAIGFLVAIIAIAAIKYLRGAK